MAEENLNTINEELEVRLHTVEKMATENKTSISSLNSTTNSKLTAQNTKIASVVLESNGQRIENQSKEDAFRKLQIKVETLCRNNQVLQGRLTDYMLLQEQNKDNDSGPLLKEMEVTLKTHLASYEKLRKELRERFGTLGGF